MLPSWFPLSLSPMKYFDKFLKTKPLYQNLLHCIYKSNCHESHTRTDADYLITFNFSAGHLDTGHTGQCTYLALLHTPVLYRLETTQYNT